MAGAAAHGRGTRAGWALIGCLMLALPGPPTLAAPDRQQLEQVRERIGVLQERIRSTTGEQDALSAELAATEKAIGGVARRLRVLEAQLESQRLRLGELRQREQEQLGALQAERRALSRQIRAAYAMGRQERLKILLNQQEPARVSRLLTYYDYLNRARARRMARIERRVSELGDTRAAIGREEQRLRALAASELDEERALQEQQQARKRVLERLARELTDQSRELSRLERDEARLNALLEDIGQALADVPDHSPADEPFARRRGALPWPARGRIGAEFGARRVGGLRWDGVMIEAPEGGEVRVVHHGRVAFADWLRGFGLLLIVDHGDGWMTLYGHNQTLFKDAGDWVQADEPVALTGASGGRETPGVYFGIRHQGQAVDPLRWCQRPDGRKVG
jgi:septal ring factor EnvC (AmiA/AmiB activator)